MFKYGSLLLKCHVFEALASGDPFDLPLDKRNWDTNIGDSSIWSTMLNELPLLFKRKGDEKALNEWVTALKMRMGFPPKYNEEVKSIIRKLWKLDFNSMSEEEYLEAHGKVVLFLRQFTYTDPDWIAANTYTPPDYDDDYYK